jgi:hypothetical protein
VSAGVPAWLVCAHVSVGPAVGHQTPPPPAACMHPPTHTHARTHARAHRQRQTDARLAIEDANARFYDAFRSGNAKVRAWCGALQLCGQLCGGLGCASSMPAAARMPPMSTGGLWTSRLRLPLPLPLVGSCVRRRWRLCGGRASRCRSFTPARPASQAGTW